MWPCTVLRVLALLLMHAWSATAFSFTFSNPTQCDDLHVSWTGGTAPFYLLVTPQLGVPQNISIPENAFSNGKGNYTTTLTLASKSHFLLTMSDSTGFNTGGSTAVLTVQDSQGGSCNTTIPRVPFDYQTPSPLLQCRDFTFSNYAGAIQPITIFAIIPGGDALVLHPPPGPTQYEWPAKVASGNAMVFIMVDAKGRQGGSSALKNVEPSDVTDCLSGDLPSTTSGAPTASNAPSSSSQPSSTSSAPPTDANGSVSKVAVIVGTLAGCLIAFACVASLGFFFWKKRTENKDKWAPYGRNSRRMQSVDLLHQPPPPANDPDQHSYGNTGSSYAPTGPSSSSHANRNYAPSSAAGERTGSPFDDPPYLPPGHQPEPFMLSHPTQAPPAFDSYEQEDHAAPTTPTSPVGPGEDTRARRDSHALSTATATSAARRKAQMAGVSGYNAPSRFILHTDLDDVQPNEDGFIELPPQYAPSRRPTQRAHPEAGPHGALATVAEGQTPTSSIPLPTAERYRDVPNR